MCVSFAAKEMLALFGVQDVDVLGSHDEVSEEAVVEVNSKYANGLGAVASPVLLVMAGVFVKGAGLRRSEGCKRAGAPNAVSSSLVGDRASLESSSGCASRRETLSRSEKLVSFVEGEAIVTNATDQTG